MPKETLLQFGEGGIPLQTPPAAQPPSGGNITRALIVATVIIIGLVATIKYFNAHNGKEKRSEL